MEVKILRTPMGEIIGKVKSFDGQVYELQDATTFSVKPSEANPNEVEVDFRAIAMFAATTRQDKPTINLELGTYNVFMAYTPVQDVVDNYLQALESDAPTQIEVKEESKIIT